MEGWRGGRGRTDGQVQGGVGRQMGAQRAGRMDRQTGGQLGVGAGQLVSAGAAGLGGARGGGGAGRGGPHPAPATRRDPWGHTTAWLGQRVLGMVLGGGGAPPQSPLPTLGLTPPVPALSTRSHTQLHPARAAPPPQGGVRTHPQINSWGHAVSLAQQ